MATLKALIIEELKKSTPHSISSLAKALKMQRTKISGAVEVFVDDGIISYHKVGSAKLLVLNKKKAKEWLVV